MRCLSIKQPWAGLIVAGIKDVENRSRATSYRGPLLIHAAKTMDWDGFYRMRAGFHEEPHKTRWNALCGIVDDAAKLLEPNPVPVVGELFPFGAIIGQVNVLGSMIGYSSRWAGRNCFHWVLGGAKRFDTPIPYPGRLGLFHAPDPDAEHLFKPHDGRTRRVCLRDEPCDVVITRPGKWGNPYKVVKHGKLWAVEGLNNSRIERAWSFRNRVDAVRESIKFFRIELRRNKELMASLKELKGKRLGCFCAAGQPCHGDVLVKLVEEESDV